MFKKAALILIVFMMAVPALKADRRNYVWTYQYATIAPGASEIEFYQTTKLDETNSWEYRIEIESGLTPNWDFSVYQIFSQKEGENFKWDAFQLRTRYRLAEGGQLFFDPIIYLEYRRKLDFKEQNKLEAKLILARDMDKVNLAINPVYEFFWAPGNPKHEIGLDVGLSYSPSYKLTIGVESTTRHEWEKEGDALVYETKTGSYFGPTVSYATGNVFYTVGYAWGITDDSNDGRVRFIMGIGI